MPCRAIDSGGLRYSNASNSMQTGSVPQPHPDQRSSEPVVISSSVGTALKVVDQKPAHVLQLPGPRVIPLPSLLNGGLHDQRLPKMALLCGWRASQYTAQEQRHIKGLGQARPPM